MKIRVTWWCADAGVWGFFLSSGIRGRGVTKAIRGQCSLFLFHSFAFLCSWPLKHLMTYFVLEDDNLDKHKQYTFFCFLLFSFFFLSVILPDFSVSFTLCFSFSWFYHSHSFLSSSLSSFYLFFFYHHIFTPTFFFMSSVASSFVFSALLSSSLFIYHFSFPLLLLLHYPSSPP